MKRATIIFLINGIFSFAISAFALEQPNLSDLTRFILYGCCGLGIACIVTHSYRLVKYDNDKEHEKETKEG